MALTEREKANREMAQRREAEARRRKQGLTDKVSTKAVDRQAVDQAETADTDGSPKDVLLKAVPKDMRDWLEREREKRGFRSRQLLLMAILSEARGK